MNDEKEKIKEIKGETRGVTFATDARFISRRFGQEALSKAERALSKEGKLFFYSRIRPMDFYPLSLRLLSFIIYRDELGFTEKDFKDMGKMAPKESLVIKLFARFFFSVERTVKQSPQMWSKHYTMGDLSAEADEEKKEATVRLENFKGHPLFCIYFEGYLETILNMVVNGEVECEEVKCPFKDGRAKTHEFHITWS